LSLPVTLPGSRPYARLTRFFQLALWALGLASLVWAFSDPRFRDAEGFLSGGVGLPVTIGVALLILGWALARPLKRSALWFALALVGQAVALQMIEAGSEVGYQHYKPVGRLLRETHPLLLIFLAMQTALVALGLRNRWPQIRPWLGRNFRLWQLLGVGLVFLLSSATLSQEVSRYATELVFAAFVQAVSLGTIILMVWALPEETLLWFKRICDKLIGQPGREVVGTTIRVDRVPLLAAVWVTALAAVLSFVVYERHPHVPDELAYLYHARYLANGVLTTPAPPVREAFEVYLMQIDADQWYPVPPPGWPAMLAIGALFGVPWLVNPVLAGLNLLAIYILLQEFYPRRLARLAILLLCVSPWYVFLGMSFMTHMFTLTCALVAAVGVAWARRTGRAIWAWLGGLALGMMAVIRPLEALAVAGLLGLWAIGVGGKRLKISAIVGLILASMAVGAIVLPYNKLLTGDPTVFPIMAYTEQIFGPNANALGFGPDRGMGWGMDPFPGHSPRDALINANLNTFSINVELFGWSIGSLLIVALIVFSGTLRRSDYLMLAVVAVLFWLHFFYYFSGGPDFGARYWFLMLVPLVALTARGIQYLERKLQADPIGSVRSSTWVMVAVVSLCLLTLINFFPWRAIDKYFHYRGMRPDIRHLAKEYGFGQSLVLVRGDARPDYVSAAAYNPVDLRADVPVYAWDRDTEVRLQVLNAYQDRSVWIVDGPSLTQNGFRVVAGPLPAHELIAQERDRE
jgi:hypothetical protein